MTNKAMDKILYVSLGLLVLFAWWDSKNLSAIKQIDELWRNCFLWKIFGDVISPAQFTMWIGILAAIGLIWYIISKDKSEALAIFLTPAILIWTGGQDLLYYFFSTDTLAGTIGCWANAIVPVRIISDFLGEACPTVTSFMLSVILGITVAYYIYGWLKRARW